MPCAQTQVLSMFFLNQVRSFHDQLITIREKTEAEERKRQKEIAKICSLT